jgi:hypothetical protein
MAEETAILTIKDRYPLLVSKKRLVENSPVFNKIFVDLRQREHDIADFTPDIVELFITLLEDREVGEIGDEDFRELHKISSVFEVEWLSISCRNWLLKKIIAVEKTIEYESMLYLTKESYCMYDKWDLTQFLETLILRVRL